MKACRRDDQSALHTEANFDYNTRLTSTVDRHTNTYSWLNMRNMFWVTVQMIRRPHDLRYLLFLLVNPFAAAAHCNVRGMNQMSKKLIGIAIESDRKRWWVRIEQSGSGSLGWPTLWAQSQPHRIEISQRCNPPSVPLFYTRHECL